MRDGQTFSVRYGSMVDLTRSEDTPFIVNKAIGVSELGRWKDGLCDCFRLGCWHPSLWNATICPQILMAQVLTRMKMNWRGDRAPDHEWQQTFRQIFIMVAAFWLLTTMLAPPEPVFGRDENGQPIRLSIEQSYLRTLLYNMISWVFGLYTLLVMTKLRRMVRARYEIPNNYYFLGQWEDLCVSFWCGCCSVAQLARQTCEYNEQPAACCSPTGLGSSFTYPIISV